MIRPFKHRGIPSQTLFIWSYQKPEGAQWFDCLFVADNGVIWEDEIKYSCMYDDVTWLQVLVETGLTRERAESLYAAYCVNTA